MERSFVREFWGSNPNCVALTMPVFFKRYQFALPLAMAEIEEVSIAHSHFASETSNRR